MERSTRAPRSRTLATAVQIGFIAVAAVAVFGFVRAAQNDQRRASCTALCSLGPAYAGKNRMAPDFELPDLSGNKVRLSSFRGKTVILNFWTRTCRPCLEEMPTIADLAKVAARRKDLVVLTVSTDESAQVIRDTLQVALGGPEIPFQVLVDSESDIVAGKFGTKLFPETWFIDPKGVIRARFDGGRDWSAALALDLADMVARPLGCPVEFERSKPKGKHAALCGDDS